MAVINPPPWMQAGQYPAQTDRLALSALVAYPGFLVDESTPTRIRQGVKPSYTNQQLKVRAAPTPNMTVIVSGGFAFIDNHDSGGAGTYVCVNDGDTTLAVQPAGGSGQYRKDVVVGSVYDADTSGDVSEWRLEVIQGAYAASSGAAQRPTLPNNAQILADLTISPNQTSIAAGNITDIRQFSVAAGGIVPVASSVAPARLAPGQTQYLTDLDSFEVGTLAGAKRALREVMRPSVSNQVSMPTTPVTAAFTDFTAAQWPPLTVTVPPSGSVKITISASIANTATAASTVWVRYRSTGALTEASSEANSLCTAGTRLFGSKIVIRTGLTPGQTFTLTPQYNVSSFGAIPSVTRFDNGQLIVEPIA